MHDVIIVASGGCIQEIFSSTQEVRCIVIDWDEMEEQEEDATIGFVWKTCTLKELPDETRDQYVKAEQEAARRVDTP